MITNNIFGTVDVAEAAYLISRGFKLAGSPSGSGGNKTIYLTGKDPHVEVVGYYNGEKVEAKKMIDSYRSLVRIVRKNVPERAV